jgi:N-acetylmuramoyl-L-alanine amidase
VPLATPPPTTPKPKPRPAPQPITPKPKPAPEPEPTLRPPPPEKPEKPDKPEATPRPRVPPAPSVTPRPAVTPAPVTPAPSTTPVAPVTVQKSGFEEEEIVPAEKERGGWFLGGPKYTYLTRSLRSQIDQAPVRRNRWRYIVVHNSGTRQGSAKAFHYYHLRVRKMPNGLAYHFVIGNGSSTGDGQIEIGSRWTRQVNGGHVHSDYLNNIALGICLVGDYNRSKPTTRQLEALEELIKYLRKRVGRVEGRVSIVKAHREINPPRWPTDCPGNRFPYRWLHGKFD